MNKVIACVLVAVAVCGAAPLIEKSEQPVNYRSEIVGDAMKMAVSGGLAAWGWKERGTHKSVYIDVMAVYFTLKAAAESASLGVNIYRAVDAKKGGQ